MFIDTDPIKKIYLIEFRSSVAKFYCREILLNKRSSNFIGIHRTQIFFRGSLFYDMAPWLEKWTNFFFFFLHARVMAFMDANSMGCTIGIGLGLMGTRFHRFYRSMVGIYRPVLSCGGKYFDFCHLMRTLLWKLFSYFTRKDFVTDTRSK